MEKFLLSASSDVSLCISDIDWEIFYHGSSRAKTGDILFSEMAKTLDSTIAREEGRRLDEIMKLKSEEKQEDNLLAFVLKLLANYTGGSEDEIDNNTSLINHGLESVGASYLRDSISKELAVDLEVFL